MYLANYMDAASARGHYIEGAYGFNAMKRRKFTVQQVSLSHKVSKAILEAHLPRLFSDAKCAPSNVELYAALRAAAQQHGAKSGPQGMLIFSCCGRGRMLYGEEGTETSILEQISGGHVPLCGMFCGGEIGPALSNGMFAFARSGPENGAPSGEPLPYCNNNSPGSCFHAYTSVFALLQCL